VGGDGESARGGRDDLELGETRRRRRRWSPVTEELPAAFGSVLGRELGCGGLEEAVAFSFLVVGIIVVALFRQAPSDGQESIARPDKPATEHFLAFGLFISYSCIYRL
jgi:hypothetical protein